LVNSKRKTKGFTGGCRRKGERKRKRKKRKEKKKENELKP
jgi:hypothetical protein